MAGWESWPALLGAWVVIGLALRGAMRDRTPRRPWSWRRPDLEWWARRKSHGEERRHGGLLQRPGLVRKPQTGLRVRWPAGFRLARHRRSRP